MDQNYTIFLIHFLKKNEVSQLLAPLFLVQQNSSKASMIHNYISQ